MDAKKLPAVKARQTVFRIIPCTFLQYAKLCIHFINRHSIRQHLSLGIFLFIYVLYPQKDFVHNLSRDNLYAIIIPKNEISRIDGDIMGQMTRQHGRDINLSHYPSPKSIWRCPKRKHRKVFHF